MYNVNEAEEMKLLDFVRPALLFVQITFDSELQACIFIYIYV